jgi:ribosome-associated heat shock protein Hsp15
MDSMNGTRLDKWLWAARFFKTRTLAAKACELGRVEANHQPARSSRDVRVGDLLSIRTEGGNFDVEVLALSDVRGPPPSPSSFIAKPKPAARPVANSPKSTKPASTLSQPLPAVPRNAIGVASSASAATAERP